jgi:hypothetical protein
MRNLRILSATISLLLLQKNCVLWNKKNSHNDPLSYKKPMNINSKWAQQGTICSLQQKLIKMEYSPRPRHEGVHEDSSIVPLFFISALDGGEWSNSRPDRFIPRKEPR